MHPQAHQGQRCRRRRCNRMTLLLSALVIAFGVWSAHPAVATVPLSEETALPPVIAPAIPTRIVRTNGAVDAGPTISAASAAVLDASSGVVLWGKRPYAVRPIASITKLLTALAFVDPRDASVGLDDPVTIAPEDVPSEGNTIFRAGDVVSAAELLTAMLVRSDNSAARALARLEALEGALVTGHAQERLAQRLGLRSLHAVDPAGLQPENRGTAIDAARLLDAALGVPPIAARLRTMRTAIAVERGGTTQRLDVWTTNHLLLDGRTHPFTIVGAKTGTLDEAGYNFVLGAERDGHAIVVAVLGSASHFERFHDAEVLVEWVFQNYRW